MWTACGKPCLMGSDSQLGITVSPNASTQHPLRCPNSFRLISSLRHIIYISACMADLIQPFAFSTTSGVFKSHYIMGGLVGDFPLFLSFTLHYVIVAP